MRWRAAVAWGASILLHLGLFALLPWRAALLAPKPLEPIAIDARFLEPSSPPVPLSERRGGGSPHTGPLSPRASLGHASTASSRAGHPQSPEPARLPAPSPGPDPAPALPAATPSSAPSSSVPNVGNGAAGGGASGGSSGSGKAAGDGSGPSGSGPGSGADGIAEIQRRLAQAAIGCYPPAAERFGLTGTTQVRFCVGARGEPSGVEVTQSSGEELLDAAAQDCVVPQAAPFPPLDRCLVVPVRFAAP